MVYVAEAIFPFVNGRCHFWTIIESFSTKKKDIHNPDSNLGPFVL